MSMRALRTATAAVAGLIVIGSAARAAQQVPAPAGPIRSPSPLRISVELVQIDATVTDENGRHVTNLDATDFEVLQDNRPQTISAFQYVPAGGTPRARTGTAAATAAVAAPPTRDGVRRTLAIVVDDLNLSFESTSRVRAALRRFIDEQMQPGDLVAILRTAAGMGALQQFTTDRRALHAAADRVRWTMMGRISSFGSSELDERLEPLEKEVFAAGTLGAIQFVMRGIEQLPGRKGILLMSDGFRMTDADMKYGRILDMMRAVADSASRGGVVIYGLDLRGLVSTGPTTSEGSTPPTPGQLAARQAGLGEAKDSLELLSHETGGFLVADSNDISRGVARILDDQQGFYLLGYVPPDATFSSSSPRFHSLRVRVKRPGLRVRSRTGFVGRPPRNGPASSPQNRMRAAVTSPFAGGEIRMRLSSFFGRSTDLGPVVQSVMHVDARDLTFTTAQDGVRLAQLEVLAMTFGDNGEVADQHSRRYTVRLTPERHAQALETGFVYNLRMPVKQPGPYQLRVALRDVGADRIGSASQFIDVPDLRKRQLTLSSLFIQGVGAAGTSDGSVEVIDPDATLAVRRFRRGAMTTYRCYAYNVARNPSGKPHVESEARLRWHGSVPERAAAVRGFAGSE
jgi:VWFA-related protein